MQTNNVQLTDNEISGLLVAINSRIRVVDDLMKAFGERTSLDVYLTELYTNEKELLENLHQKLLYAKFQ